MRDAMIRRPALAALLLAATLGAPPDRAAAQTPEELVRQAAAAVEAGPVLPVDEAGRIPTLLTFRARVQQAIAERDTAALLEAAHPEIKLSFGGMYGREDLRSSLEEDGYWGELAEALALGGILVSDSLFYAPYVFKGFPRSVDPFDGYVVLGEDVLVRAAPDPEATALDVRSWAVVVRDRAAEREAGLDWQSPWMAVRLADGGVGFMASAYLRSPIDYRAGLAFRDGRWWIVTFLAGD